MYVYIYVCGYESHAYACIVIFRSIIKKIISLLVDDHMHARYTQTQKYTYTLTLGRADHIRSRYIDSGDDCECIQCMLYTDADIGTHRERGSQIGSRYSCPARARE